MAIVFGSTTSFILVLLFHSRTIANYIPIIKNTCIAVNAGEGMRECYLFDSFQNHSCVPNTTMNYFEGSDTKYELVASRDVAAGEELTSDYETFDTLGLDGTSFQCMCGTPQCRGLIRG
jgi:hypothetical protein